MVDAAVLDRFERAVRDRSMGCHRATPATLLDTLSPLIERPAVATRLPAVGSSVTDLDVAIDPSPAELLAAHTGITPASLGVAEYGTIVLESTTAGVEAISVFCSHHIAVLPSSSIRTDLGDAVEWLADSVGRDRGSAVLATGPSATADMGALVTGAHGPSRVDVIILGDE